MTPGHRLVVDASVAVKWYVPEPDNQRAFTILSSGSRLLAPDLLISEVGNIPLEEGTSRRAYHRRCSGDRDGADDRLPAGAVSSDGPAQRGTRHRRDVSANHLRLAIRRTCSRTRLPVCDRRRASGERPGRHTVCFAHSDAESALTGRQHAVVISSRTAA